MSIPIIDLGVINYQSAYQMQKKAVAEVIAGAQECVFVCEHPTVLTLGRMADERYILCSRAELAQRAIEVVSIDRGGQVTLHAPGQLVVYPILDLKKHGKDLKDYMHQLEAMTIDFLQHHEIISSRNPGKTGVWVGSQKIASIGVGVKKWVTFHGLGININTDLELFSLINPCGLGVAMTCVQKLKGYSLDMNVAKKDFSQIFSRYFN